MSKRIEIPQSPAETPPTLDELKQKKVKSFTKKDKLKPLIKNAPVYHIVWRDAFSEVDEWHDYSSIETEDYICHTIGYLISDNSKSNYYTIASTVTIDDYFCMIINIPKAMVISKEKISFSR